MSVVAARDKRVVLVLLAVRSSPSPSSSTRVVVVAALESVSLPRDTPFARIAVATIAADSTADSARSCCDPAYRSSRRDRRERRGEEGERERRKERAHASRPPDTSRPLFTRVQRGASRLPRKNGSLTNGAHKITISRPVIAVAVVVVLVPVLVIVSSAVVQLLLLPGASYTGGVSIRLNPFYYSDRVLRQVIRTFHDAKTVYREDSIVGEDVRRERKVRVFHSEDLTWTT